MTYPKNSGQFFNIENVFIQKDTLEDLMHNHYNSQSYYVLFCLTIISKKNVANLSCKMHYKFENIWNISINIFFKYKFI